MTRAKSPLKKRLKHVRTHGPATSTAASRALSALARCGELTRQTKDQLNQAAKNALDALCAGQITRAHLREISYYSSLSLLICVRTVKTDGSDSAKTQFVDLRDSLSDSIYAVKHIDKSWTENPNFKLNDDLKEILTVAYGIYAEFLKLVTYQQIYDAEDEYTEISKKASVYKAESQQAATA
ncbi:hypothetical protein [Comamonas thiooxydans]|uniref:hypothetical protein n=1 Tax=Comamonas thiooxydans TaxID=363952 RepID=UPI001184DE09|nr:hypothetical protein [Comamonas thiooxydans]